MLRLFLIRHGQTAWNDQRRIQGHLDIPLDEIGRQQAERAAQRLQAHHEERPLEKLYSSDLRRALETAEIIAKRLEVPVETMSELRERCFGQWQGFTRAEIETRYPEEYTLLRNDPLHSRPPGGESLEDLWSRVRNALTLIRTSLPEGRVLIVGHGGSLRVILCEALTAGYETFKRLHLDNASLSLLEWKEERARLLLMNDTCHLRMDDG